MILGQILPFPGTRPDCSIFSTHIDSTFFRYSPGQFFDTCTDSTFSRYSPVFYHFRYTQIRPFSGTSRRRLSILGRILAFPNTYSNSTIFQYLHRFDPLPVIVRLVFRNSHGIYLFLVLARILPFFSTHTDSTLVRYSQRQFVNARTDCTFSQYSPGFYHFSILTLIRPFSGTRPDSFSILARILPFSGTRRILSFFGSHTDSTLFRYWPGQFFGTRPDCIIFRYSH